MLRSRPNPVDVPTGVCRSSRRSRCARCRWGFTLIELLIAVMITSMLSVVLGALTFAVHRAWEYTTGHEEADLQGAAAIDRIRYMVSQAGTYKTTGGPTTLGVRTLDVTRAGIEFPQVLVVWSGGRDGGMAANGTLDRLPRINELVVYAPDLNDPALLVEYTVPSDNSTIDFNGADFDTRIAALASDLGLQTTVLCDRLRRSVLGRDASGVVNTIGNVRFAIESFPTDDELASAAPGSDAWNALIWPQGVVSTNAGLRQMNLRIELQVETNRDNVDFDGSSTTSIPRFGSASVRYAYQP